MNTSTIDGMQVTRSSNIKDKSGAILIALGDSGAVQRFFQGNERRRRADADQTIQLESHSGCNPT
jgi:hypothetical protein